MKALLATALTPLILIGCANFDTQGHYYEGDEGESATPVNTNAAEVSSATSNNMGEQTETHKTSSEEVIQDGDKPDHQPPAEVKNEGEENSESKESTASNEAVAPNKGEEKIDASEEGSLPEVAVRKPVAKPDFLKSARQSFGAFTITVPREWKATTSDFGAFATLQPMNAGVQRAIDLYRQGVYVAEENQDAWRQAYYEKLSASTKDNLKVTQQDGRLIVQRAQSGRLQAHSFHFYPKTVVIAVTTTREEFQKEDFASSDQIVGSLEIPDPSQFLKDACATLGMDFELPEGWCVEERAGDLILRPEWQAASDASIRIHWANTTITEEGGVATYFARTHSEIEELFGGLREVSELETIEINNRPCAKITATQGKAQDLWWVVIAEKRIITIVGKNLSKPEVAKSLVESLRKQKDS